MKNSLFSNLDNAKKQVQDAQLGISAIHASRNSYNFTVQVPYEHTSYVSKYLKWKHKTYIRYRDEVRFNQKKFDDDLASAQQKLTQAQQNLYSVEGVINQETISTQNQINDINNLDNQVNNLKNNNSIQSNLPNIYFNNISTQIHSFNAQRNNLINQKNNFYQEVRDLPSRINQVNTDNHCKKIQVDSMSEQLEQVRLAEHESYKKIYDKFSNLTEVERSLIAYEMILTNNQTILAVLARCGLFIEKIAEVAIAKNQSQIFNYCLEKGLIFDLFISEQETLALKIIHGGNEFFINKLFSSNQSLKISTFFACANSDFNALGVILKYDPSALQKFKGVEGCGFGVLQYAIASNNLALIEYVSKHDPSCFKDALIGHESYLQMALTYNDQNIIQLIAANSDIQEEIAKIISSNQTDLFERLVTNIELSQDQLSLILKSCVDSNCISMAETIIEKIHDIKNIFLIAVNNKDQELVNLLISLKSNELDGEYISSLMNNSCDENMTKLLTQILSPGFDESIETPELLGESNLNQNYHIQNDYQY